MKLERIKSVLLLTIDDSSVKFRQEWVEKLRALSHEHFGDFIRLHIYPALSDQEKKSWNRSQISNKDLYNAIQSFV